MSLYKEVTKCRSCGSPRIESVLNLGNLAISDFILPGEKEQKAPIELLFCTECSLVQLRHTVERDHLYRDQYWYKSGVNESMLAALKDVVDDAMSRVELKPDDYVLDIGCNDGSMLAMYPNYLYKHGFDPAYQFMDEARKKANALIFADYFPSKDWMLFDQYKVITSIAQLYNSTNPNEYVQAVRRALHKDGVWVVQMAHLPATLDTLNVGDFVHEHLTFWTVTAFENLVARHGMHLVDVSFNDVNGGSFRAIVKHGVGPKIARDEVTKEQLVQFAKDVEALKARTMNLLEQYRHNGDLVVGLGASTKNNMVLGYYDIGPDLITCFAERSPEKWGRLTVNHIPIVSEEETRQMNPDYFFVGPFHFLKSLCNRERAFLERGGKFIVPFPDLKVIGLTEADRLEAIPTAV